MGQCDRQPFATCDRDKFLAQAYDPAVDDELLAFSDQDVKR